MAKVGKPTKGTPPAERSATLESQAGQQGQMNLKIPEDVHREFKAWCAERGWSMAEGFVWVFRQVKPARADK